MRCRARQLGRSGEASHVAGQTGSANRCDSTAEFTVSQAPVLLKDEAFYRASGSSKNDSFHGTVTSGRRSHGDRHTRHQPFQHDADVPVIPYRTRRLLGDDLSDIRWPVHDGERRSRYASAVCADGHCPEPSICGGYGGRRSRRGCVIGRRGGRRPLRRARPENQRGKDD